MDFVAYLLLSLKGRIARLQFWMGTLILGVIRFAAPYLIVAIVGLSERAVLLAILVAFALAYPSYALMAKRFQDRDKPGLLALALIVPFYTVNLLYTFRVFDPLDPPPIAQALDAIILIIALWFLVELGFLKGTQGPNRYGPDPLGRQEADARL
jgi:uncharacterized membrane protein YhaH (DUF805 family)